MVVSSRKDDFLNEVLSITAQEYDNNRHMVRHRSILNEVLSITAQESFRMAGGASIEEDSSMKS